jgi:hypothetical protein
VQTREDFQPTRISHEGRYGAVASSSARSQANACSLLVPHISADGWSPPQNGGRSGWPKMRHRLSSASWTQRTPAGFPFGIPGMGLVIDGAVQQAPQPGRQARAGSGMVIRGNRDGEAAPPSIPKLARAAADNVDGAPVSCEHCYNFMPPNAGRCRHPSHHY